MDELGDNDGIDKVSTLIAGALAKRGLAEHALTSLTLFRVNEWLKERFPTADSPARAQRVADHVLHIACTHSIILQELQQQLPDLHRFLATNCPFSAVQEIRLSRGDARAGNALAPGNPPA